MIESLDPDTWYEGRELAKRLGVSLKTLQRAGVPCSRLTARRTLYKGQDVNLWLEARNTRNRRRAS